MAELGTHERRALLRQLAKTPQGARFVCGSGSMHPTIAVGQEVRVHAVPLETLRVGDVVVYEGAGEHYMLHRIVLFGPGRRWFLHLGDAPSPRGPRRALSAAIVGKVSALPRKHFGPRVYLRGLREAMSRRLRRTRR